MAFKDKDSRILPGERLLPVLPSQDRSQAWTISILAFGVSHTTEVNAENEVKKKQHNITVTVLCSSDCQSRRPTQC